MKKFTLMSGIFLLGLCACHKQEVSSENSTPPSNPANPSTQVTSLTLYTPSSKNLTKDTLIYDAGGNLIRLSYTSYDSSGGVSYVDSGSYYFNVDPETRLANSFSVVWNKTAGQGSGAETHNLFFDGQKRLIRDTLISGQTNPGDSAAMYFFYSANGIACHSYTMHAYDPVKKTNGWGMSGIDTITLSNGNIASQYELIQNGAVWNTAYSYVIGNYSNYTNPLYSFSQTSGLGVFLTNSNILDCISQNLAADGILKWSVDKSGRVVSGIAANGSTTVFTYAR